MNPWLFILAGLALAAKSGPELPPGDHGRVLPPDLAGRQVFAAEIGPYWPTEEDE